MIRRSLPGALGAWLGRRNAAGNRQRAGAVRLCGAVTLLAALALAVTGIGKSLDDSLLTMRSQAFPRPATGRIVLVEIDAKSLAAHHSWPWPRSLHARAVDVLDRAGVAQIGFDVDFSAPSTADEDRALAMALERAHAQIILPTFRQSQSQGSSAWSENLPLPELRRHAMLASVNVAPGEDGMVRNILTGVATGGTPRPSLAAALAGSSGRIGQDIPLDRALDMATLPRVSFADLVAGRVPVDSLRGKSVLIGATAIEMGDRYASPGRGVIPGALIQVLAAETLLQQSAPTSHGAFAGLLVLALVLARALRLRRLPSLPTTAAAAGLVLALPMVIEQARLGTIAIAPALGGLAVLAFAATLVRGYEALRQSRLTDGETGLPNSAGLRTALARHDRATALVLRIDNYADVLAVLGPQDAGRLLLRVVERLRAGVIGPIGRIEPGMLGWVIASDDELEQEDQALAAAALCNQPFEIDGRVIRVVPVLGIATMTGDGGLGDIMTALAAASSAAERAHAQGLRWDRHSVSAVEEHDWRLSLASEIDAALTDGSIWMAYQPKLDIARGTIHAVEALVRWSHPQRGAIPPDRLVALVEEMGRISDFTLAVLEKALAAQADWLGRGHRIGVAVNVSAQLPSQPGFVAAVAAVIARYPGAAQWLTLEITESAVMGDAELTVAALEQLTAMGLRISIDDYGTGQSTLAYLKDLPAHEIKIDKSFVLGLESTRSDQLLVQSTIQLAHGLGYKVVAEGVENANVLALLASFGCDIAQGWHIGRPMAAAQLLEFLAPREAEAA